MLLANLILKETVIKEEFKKEYLIKILDEAIKLNIKKLVIAPAYYDHEGETDIESVKNMVLELNNYLQDNNMNLKVYPGNLLRDNFKNIKSYIKGTLGTINDSKYVLLDVEEGTKINELLDIVFEYKLRNIIPIIVSPERIKEIIEKNKRIKKLIEEGCLFQLDPASLQGAYGKKVKSTAKALMKKDIYKCVGFKEDIEGKFITKEIIELSKKSLFMIKAEEEKVQEMEYLSVI